MAAEPVEPVAIPRRTILGALAGGACGSLLAACSGSATSPQVSDHGSSSAVPATSAGSGPSTSGGTSSGSSAGGSGGSVGVGPSSVTGRVDVREFGAVGNGRDDDTQALRRALQALRPGAVLVFPAGHVFTHSATLSVATPRVTLAGPGRLLATQEGTSALMIGADGVVVDGMSLGVANTTRRWSAPDQHKLFVGSSSGVVVRKVSVDSSAAAGIFCDGAASFLLDHVQVSGTRADGIHMTNGSHDGRVVSPRTSATGDDGVAVVSYQSDSSACHDISVTSPVVAGTSGGRGISVVGGSNVTYRDIDVSGSNAAAVYIACESGDFVTDSTSNVIVASGRITDANTNATIDHGAVLVFSGRSGGSVHNVQITGLDISGTRPTASRQIGVVVGGPACVASGISFDDLQLDTRPEPYQGNAPVADVALSDVRAGGALVIATAGS